MQYCLSIVLYGKLCQLTKPFSCVAIGKGSGYVRLAGLWIQTVILVAITAESNSSSHRNPEPCVRSMSHFFVTFVYSGKSSDHEGLSIHTSEDRVPLQPHLASPPLIIPLKTLPSSICCLQPPLSQIPNVTRYEKTDHL